MRIFLMQFLLKDTYIFTSERLGFRNWSDEDLPAFAAMNADPVVMEHFAKTLNAAESEAFLTRLRNHYLDRGYTYYAVDVLETGQWIGFIGLAYQDYEASFTPATDIGWRLIPEAWGHGFATEGAKRCLEFAFESLNMESVVATCTATNFKSEKVMQKIGMTRQGMFNHPRLKDHPDLERCLWYVIKANG